MVVVLRPFFPVPSTVNWKCCSKRTRARRRSSKMVAATRSRRPLIGGAVVVCRAGRQPSQQHKPKPHQAVMMLPFPVKLLPHTQLPMPQCRASLCRDPLLLASCPAVWHQHPSSYLLASTQPVMAQSTESMPSEESGSPTCQLLDPTFV